MNTFLLVLQSAALLLAAGVAAVSVLKSKAYDETELPSRIIGAPKKTVRRLTKEARFGLFLVFGLLIVSFGAKVIEQSLTTQHNEQIQQANSVELRNAERIMRLQTEALNKLSTQTEISVRSFHELERIATRFQRLRVIASLDISTADLGLNRLLEPIQTDSIKIQKASFRPDPVTGKVLGQDVLHGGFYPGVGTVAYSFTPDDISIGLVPADFDYRSLSLSGADSNCVRQLCQMLVGPPTVEVRLFAPKGSTEAHVLASAPLFVFTAPSGPPDFIAVNSTLLNEERRGAFAADSDEDLSPMLCYKPLLQKVRVKLPLEFLKGNWSSTPRISCPEDLAGSQMAVVIRNLPNGIDKLVELSRLVIEFDHLTWTIEGLHVRPAAGAIGLSMRVPDLADTNAWSH